MLFSIASRRRYTKSDKRATAAVEFAIVAPVLALCLSAAGDYGLAMWSRSCLTNAVAQGAYYAFRTGTSVSPSNIVTLVQSANPLGSGTGSAVTATVTNPALCYCPGGSPITLGPAVNCGSTCPSDGTAAGNYITITGYYRLIGISPMPQLSIAGDQISDTVTVRLK